MKKLNTPSYYSTTKNVFYRTQKPYKHIFLILFSPLNEILPSKQSQYLQSILKTHVSVQLSSIRETVRNVWSVGELERGAEGGNEEWKTCSCILPPLRCFLWANCIKHPKHLLYRQPCLNIFPSSHPSCQYKNHTCITSKKKSLGQKAISVKRHVNQTDLAANSIS